MIGTSASVELAGAPEPSWGDAAGDSVPATDAAAEAEGLAEAPDRTGADGPPLTVNVVVPRSRSPSSADFEVQRIVYVSSSSGTDERSSDICFLVAALTAPPCAMTVPEASTTASELPDGSSSSVNVATIVDGADTVSRSAGVIVASSA